MYWEYPDSNQAYAFPNLYNADHEIKFYRRLDEYPILTREGIIIPIDASPAPGNSYFDVTASDFLVVIGNGDKAIVLEDVGDYTPNSTAGNGQWKSGVHFNQAEGKLTAEPIDPCNSVFCRWHPFRMTWEFTVTASTGRRRLKGPSKRAARSLVSSLYKDE